MTRLIPMALSFAALAISGSLSAQAPNITATKSDGTPAATKKNPGDTVTYTNTISNTGTANATGVTFTDPDVNGSAVQMSTLKVSPLAFDDNYSGTILSGVTVNTATATNFSVTANDYVGIYNNAAGVLTITAFDATSANGGTVSMTTSGANIGKFIYTSAAGFTGVDSFTYTISNTGFTSTATVIVTVSGPGIFFVSDSTGDDTNGKGTLASPYKTLTKVATLDANTSQRIFVLAGAYSAGMTMEANEQIIGQGVRGVSFDLVVAGVTAGADSVARPLINGTLPTITAASGSVITLAENNTIRGVSINSTVAGYAVTGSAINSLQLGSSGGSTASDTSVTASSASSGCLNLSGGGNGSVNVLALLANSASAGRSLTVSGRTGGTTSVIGKLTDTGAGVSLSGNAGATFNFRSFALATGANTAFSATGGGTVNATQGESDGIDNDGDTSTDEADEANIINNVTGGTGVNIASTNIGASNFIIRSLTSTGGTSPGINLNTTGNSGGLFVTGDSGGTNNASGGSITNKTGSTLTTGTPGVVAISTANLRLGYMNITGCNHSGIYGSTVNGFVLSRCNINTNGNELVSNPDETGVDITNLTGTAIAGANPTAINFCVIQNNMEFELQINNSSGTLTDFQVNSCTMSSNNASLVAPHGNLFSFLASGTAIMTTNVVGSTFTGNAQAPGGTTATGAHCDVSGSGVMTANISTSTFNNNNAAVNVSASGAGTLTFDVHDNPSVTLNRSHGLNCFLAADATGLVNGKFRNNVVGTLGTAGSGSELGFGIRIQNEAVGSANAANFLVSGNTVQETLNFNSFNVNAGLNTIPSTKTTNLTIQNNNFKNSAARAITIQQNNNTNGTSAGTIHAHIASNTFSGIIGQAADGTEIRLRQLAANGGVFRLNQTADTNLATVNGLTLADLSISGTITYNQGLPTAPPLLFAPGGVEKAAASIASVFTSALPVAPVKSSKIRPNPASSSLEAVTQVASRAPSAEIARLAQTDLDSMVSSALALWKASGLTPEQEEHLRSLTFEVSSLDGIRLGEADGHIIRIDADAGGSGWYVDASDKHFTASSATRFSTSPSAAPAGRLDLLTALLHEMGHTLGLEDSYLEKDRDSLMYGFLTLGERRLPAKRQAFGARSHDHKHGETHFLTGAVSIGVLPPGKSITITYDVIINNPATTSTLSSQATVSGSNFSNVLTDDLVTGGDPLLPGAADPTVTQIDLPDVSVTVAPASTAEDGAGNLVYTFTRTGATTAAMTVNFAATGTASTTTDYSVTNGTGVVNFTAGTGLGSIVIPIGSSTATAIVDPSVDATVEPDETVIVSITSGFYDIVAPVSATGTITNDDTGIELTLPDTSLFEDQTNTFAFTFTRTGNVSGGTTANFTYTTGSAVEGTDYSRSGAATFSVGVGTVVFAPGDITKIVTIDPTADNLVEGNETVALTLGTGTGYSVLGTALQTATIVDDDVNVSLTSVVPATSVEDSGVGMVYTFTRSGGSTANALTVNVTVSGTAGFTGDYTTSGFATNLAGVATITFAGGSATKTVTITPSSDVTNEPDETVILTVAANGTPDVTGGYTVGGTPSGTGTILNDDTQVSVTVAPTPVGEASGTGMVYTFSRTGPTTAALPINFTKGGTASIATSDFSAASSDGGMNFAAGTVTIPIGSSTVTITLTPLEDAMVEGSETAILTVAAGSGYGATGSPATGTITDNDTATIGFVTTTSTVGEATANDVQQLVLTLTTTGAGTPTLAYAVSVNVTGPSGTATNGTDYTPPTGVTFAANSLNAAQVAASIAITNDRAVEGSETAGLGLAINTDGTGGAVTIAVGAAATHTTTITDNDTATVSYAASTSSIGEAAGNDSIGLTLTVTGNGAGPLVLERSASFNITTTGGSATNGTTDYTLPGAVSIPATTLSAAVTNFNLAITNDQLLEGSETAILGLTLNTDNTGGQVTVGAGNAHTTTITDNEAATITFAAATSNVAENAGPDLINLVLTITGSGTGTAQLASAVSVNVTGTGGSTATGAGVDYTLPALVTFPANSLNAATQAASLGITNDAIVEASETVNLGLVINTDPTALVTIGAANAHTTTILDDDTATVSFSKIIDGSEGPPIVNGKFRITQTAQSSTNTVVNYTVSGSAVPGPGNDYATLSGTATILAGNTFVDVDVIVQADVGSEPPETVIITFSSFGAHDADITLGAPTSATVTIYSGTIITGTWTGAPLITTAGSFNCTGLTLDIDLGFVPAIPQQYTLVHADGGVTGNFNDLPPNGVIALSINGVIYYFQATYGPNDVFLTSFTPDGLPAWTWVSGPNSRNGVGVYGNLGVAAPTNNPGARQGAMNWQAPDGSLWMFGGYGYATAVTNPPRYLNDIWQYRRDIGQWVWRGGANTFNSPGTYGAIGVEAPGNAPGARHTGTTWTDADGNLWLFGGYGIGASGAPAWLNDLWRFNRTNGQWTHMKGSTATGGAATYGVLDTPAAGNTPGARSSATGVFRNGNLWLFGGYSGTNYYNDLWRFEIATGNWAWVEGSNVPNQNGVYGVQGTPNAANVPGSRRDATGWAADNGTLWFFGGLGLPASGATAGDMNDLWRYNPATGDWTWIKGASTVNGTATYGTQGTFAAGNTPGARSAGGGWVTVDGDLWLVGGFKDSNLTFDDVWVFDVGSQQWTHRLGSQGLLGQSGVYGNQGQINAANKPGGRFTPSTWVTLNGNLYIFGGGGADAFGNTGRLSDLWSYGIPKPATAPYDELFPDPFPSELIVNDAPSASDATAGTMAYVPVSGKLTGSDPDGDRLLFSAAGSTISQGTLTLNLDGTWTYTPAYGFTGVASFKFKAADNYGGESAVKTLVISVSSNPADSDGDGIADSYEQSIWGSLAAADGDGDADLDGQSNYFEFLAGTNPLDGNETLVTAPTVSGTTSTNGHVLLNLNHVRPGVNYHLETSSDLDAWTRIGTFTFDVSGSATVEDPTPATGAPRFYRMSLEATPALVVP
ncbi:hypothetical protein BGE01nite_19490 [Brevifollis gellanilyticus]|uniref:Calx-beta domain-containing protein n=2 Tax=Brevifollis gellanilyticus TaxID=748831 RepID=A0A512M7D8_9BACT|nr:hypothetical protein BGE01nite_19490 [Brevifollis gellanilyticus]